MLTNHPAPQNDDPKTEEEQVEKEEERRKEEKEGLKMPAPKSPDHHPNTVGGDQDNKGEKLYPLQPDHLPDNVGANQAAMDCGHESQNSKLIIITRVNNSQQLDHKHVVGGHIVDKKQGHAQGHDKEVNIKTDN